MYPGLGWVIWRSKEYLPESIVFHVNYLGSDQASVTLNFSRGAGMIIAQYYQVRPVSVHASMLLPATMSLDATSYCLA